MFKIPTLFILSITSTFGISIGTWNVENNPNNETEDANFNVTIELIGEFGILGLNETDLGSSARLLNLVNTFHNTNAYQIILSEPVFYDRVALMYDTRQVTLLESTEVDNFLLTRPFLYGLFRPNGTAGSMDFYVLTTHLKSGDTIEVQNTRSLEAAVIQNEIDSLPPNSRIILAGDLNMQSSNQTAWSILTGGTNRLQDVAQAEGH
jgi:endonuclease/exonuclease/phosphatase family metal-dependent hydrolase